MSLHIKVYERFDVSVTDIIMGYWHVTSSDFAGPAINVPDGYHEIAFDLLTKEIEINLTRHLPIYKRSGLVVNKLYLRFMPFGLSLLANIPQSLLTDPNPNLNIHDLFDDRAFSDKLLKIAFASSEIDTKIIQFENIISKKLPKSRSIHPCIKNLSLQILENKGTTRLQSLYKDCNLSDRQIEILFAKQIGLTPKSFSKVVRVGHLLVDKFSNPDLHLTKLSYEYGFADQSHLIKEFKSLLGITPLHFFKIKANTNYF